MCAFEMVTEHGGNKPDGDVVRLLTPLTASEMIINEGLDILEAAVLGN